MSEGLVVVFIPCKILPIGPGRKETVYLSCESLDFIFWACVNLLDFRGFRSGRKHSVYPWGVSFPQLFWHEVPFKPNLVDTHVHLLKELMYNCRVIH